MNYEWGSKDSQSCEFIVFVWSQFDGAIIEPRKIGYGCTEGCMGEQTSLEFDLTFVDVLLHKLVQAY